MRLPLLVLLALLAPPLIAAPAAAPAPAKPGEDAKLVSGMSILGNNDAPKSLYIVPWKSSELARQTQFGSSLLSEELVPVDKPVFQRELDFYKLGHAER